MLTEPTPPKLHNCLAHIDALLLNQELALRAMHVESQIESLKLASVQSNAQQVADSAIDAGNLVLSTLRELQYGDELGAIIRQVRSIAAVHKLATDSVNVISYFTGHTVDGADRLCG
jgi:gamma-glutamyl:cysteine ligase YbdK (ATP-grasp superfamily)